MELTITKIIDQTSYSLDPTRKFGILLSKILSTLHMLHWYTENYNVHVILGDLYGDLDDLFDKLQEEIIGTSKSQECLFPSFSTDMIDLENLEFFQDTSDHFVSNYFKLSSLLTAIISSKELDVYISSVKSGLNNTKEDILSRINKTNYLISMV